MRFSRRGFLISSFIVLTICLGALAWIPTALGAVIVIFFVFFMLVLSAVSNLVGVFPAASFPTQVYSSGIGVATAMPRLGSVISTFLLPVMIVQLPCLSMTAMGIAGVLTMGLVVLVCWAS